jgi:sugar-specific transcriptional regulator TrmB
VATVIEQLQRLGLSGYEAKAYVALAAAGQPLNGYEVAKRSGVPRSTVYETLAKLVDRGAVFEVRTGNDTTDYLPLPPATLIARFRREFDESLSALEVALPSVAAPQKTHLVSNLDGRRALLDRAVDLVESAGNDLFVSIWPDEYGSVKQHLMQAAARGVDISVVYYGEDPEPVGYTYSHRFSMPEVVLENVGCRLFVVAADRVQAVIGGFVGEDGWGIYTEDPAVVLVAVEFVRHDIAMQVIVDRVGEEVVKAFWFDDPELVRLRSDRGAPGIALRQAHLLGAAGVPRAKRRPKRAAKGA